MQNQVCNQIIVWTLLCFAGIVLLGTEKQLSNFAAKVVGLNPFAKAKRDVALVVASTTRDNTSWVADHFPEWDKFIYVVDDNDARYKVPENKGHEVMVYLTYIIDNYSNLPSTMIFSHAQQYQWHNDDPLYDGARVLRHLRLPHVQEQGYVNLRCDWFYGCPVEIRPHEDAADPEHELQWQWNTQAAVYYKESFEALFPGVEVPEEVGTHCCAQFAVSRDAVRGRGREEYVRMREWVLETDLKDAISGRVFEYGWHIVFGKQATFCPNAADCYCKTFGLCHLECLEEGHCEGWYDGEPARSLVYDLPEGWPEIGWEGEVRDVEELRRVQEEAYDNVEDDGS